MLQEQYPALWQFLGAYLHQDWRDEYRTTGEALNAFLSEEPDLARLLPGEIKALLRATEDPDLDALIERLGSFFVPRLSGVDARAWLVSVADLANRHGEEGS